MQAISVFDIKPFMQLLFQPSELDTCDFISGELCTDMNYTLDGRINDSFFSKDERSILQLENATHLPWSLAREKVFLLIKGKKTPTRMKLVLRLSNHFTQNIIDNCGSNITSSDIDAMYLNIVFQEETLKIFCGISYNIFTLDKNLEEYLASHFVTFIKSNNITCN